jgi:hypothetical protein
MVNDPDPLVDEWRTLSVNTRTAPVGILWKALEAWFSGLRGKPRRKNPRRHGRFRCRFHGGGFLLAQDFAAPGRNPEKNWHLYIKGVPAILFAKGRFPAAVFQQIAVADAAGQFCVVEGSAGVKGNKMWRAGGRA